MVISGRLCFLTIGLFLADNLLDRFVLFLRYLSDFEGGGGKIEDWGGKIKYWGGEEEWNILEEAPQIVFKAPQMVQFCILNYDSLFD